MVDSRLADRIPDEHDRGRPLRLWSWPRGLAQAFRRLDRRARGSPIGRTARRARAARQCQPVTILKPLHGAEPLLEQALATVCAQDYPTFQIVFGVHGRHRLRAGGASRGCGRAFPAATSPWSSIRPGTAQTARSAT